MNGVQAGAIAGIGRGVAAAIFYVVGTSIAVFPSLGYDLGFLLIHEIIVGVIFGAIWGWIYPLVYDKIPGKGVVKGIVYSMLLFVLTNVFVAALFSKGFPSELSVMMAIVFLWMGFWSWLGYGPVLGALYKK